MNGSRSEFSKWRPVAWAGVAVLETGGALAGADWPYGLAMLVVGALALNALLRPRGWNASLPAASLALLIALPAWPPLAWLAAAVAMAGMAAERAPGSMGSSPAAKNHLAWRSPTQPAP